MDNQWADPEGFEDKPPRICYRIRSTEDTIVDRFTSFTWDGRYQRYYHCLSPMDQHFADKITALIQRACGYFYCDDADWEPLEGVPDIIISDTEVEKRIKRIDLGENTREAVRTSKLSYPLQELPFDQKRALIEQVEKLKQEWSFEILGPEEAPPAKP